MKKLLLLSLLLSTHSYAIELDKVAHFSVSYGLSYTGLHLLPENLRWFSPVMTTLIGVGKEMSDSRFDWNDMLANGSGVTLSVIVFELE